MAKRASFPSCLVLLFVVVVVVLPFLSPLVSAWGAEGHYMTCAIAQPLFSAATLSAVQDLLPEYAEGKLAGLCAWADQVRFRYPWSSPLHFIDTPDFRCTYDYQRDCHSNNGARDMCVAGAINNYTSQLTTYGSSVSQYNLTESLLFLAHFVGDIHQPLHTGFTGDLGGNSIRVHWFTRIKNLHHVWDSDIIDTAKDRFFDSDVDVFAQDLSMNITDAEVSNWGTCSNEEIACPDTYASEGIKLACQWAYKNATPGTTLGDEYFLSRLPIVEERLQQGGVRLATILNGIFDGKSSSSIKYADN